jgi:hypothetical protein
LTVQPADEENFVMTASRVTFALATLVIIGTPRLGRPAVVTELLTSRAAFEARLGGAVRVVDFDDVDTSVVDPVGFAGDRYGASHGVLITGAGGQYASRAFGFPQDYPTSSAPNQYAPGPIETTLGGGNETELSFLAGAEPGAVAGFGVVFIDPDLSQVSSLTIFDRDGMALASEGVPAGDGSLVFRGFVTADDVTGAPVPVIARARVVNGTGWPAGSFNDGVPLDDVVFGIPVSSITVPTGSSTTTTTTVAASTTTTTLCAPAPLAGCRKPRVSGKSTLLVRNSPADAKDRLLWSWARGATREEFGDPLGTTAFSLCAYDDSGLKLALTVPPAGTCAGSACWRRTRLGFAYNDKDPIADRVLALRLGARIMLKGKGGGLRLPALPFDPPVTVQLVRRDDRPCWDARFQSALKSTSSRFRAISD